MEKTLKCEWLQKPGEELGETSYLQNCFELIQKVCLMESVRIIKKNA